MVASSLVASLLGGEVTGYPGAGCMLFYSVLSNSKLEEAWIVNKKMDSLFAFFVVELSQKSLVILKILLSLAYEVLQ